MLLDPALQGLGAPLGGNAAIVCDRLACKVRLDCSCVIKALANEPGATLGKTNFSCRRFFLKSTFVSENLPKSMIPHPLRCYALLSDGKVSAEVRGHAFPGVARP